MNEEKIKNGFIGLENTGLGCLKSIPITEVRTLLGYLHILEYQLQDNKYLHVVQYHFNDILEENSVLPKIKSKSFYNEKDKAIEFAKNIGYKLLHQYGL